MKLSLDFLKASLYLFKPISIKLSSVNLKPRDLFTAISAAITIEVSGRAIIHENTEQIAMIYVIFSIYIALVSQCLLIAEASP